MANRYLIISLPVSFSIWHRNTHTPYCSTLILYFWALDRHPIHHGKCKCSAHIQFNGQHSIIDKSCGVVGGSQFPSPRTTPATTYNDIGHLKCKYTNDDQYNMYTYSYTTSATYCGSFVTICDPIEQQLIIYCKRGVSTAVVKNNGTLIGQEMVRNSTL